MTDLDSTFATAIRAETARAVAPPYAVIERRARAYRVRRTVVAAAAAAVAIGGAAVAVPRLAGRTSAPPASGHLKPFEEFANDPAARAAYRACRDPYKQPVPGDPGAWTVPDDVTDRCFRQVGYEPPPHSVTVTP